MPTSTTTVPMFDLTVIERMDQMAAARHQTADSIMREAVEQYIERETVHDQLNAETLASLAAFQADGLHLTGEEVDAWLAKIELGEDAPMPKCHV